MNRNQIFTLFAITTIAALVTTFGCNTEPPASPEPVRDEASSLEHALNFPDEPAGSLGKHGGLREAQSATAKYHSLKRALADGYAPVTPCDELPGVGAQGFHYLNSGLLDGVVDPTKPELVIYIPTKNGLKFVGVEYAVPANLVPPTPSLFGHEFHPFPDPNAPILFVLHLWLLPEVPNPSGLFADWNPDLTCGDN